jgi:hypothetical protein
MATGFIEAGFLNVVATPHPKGVYERLLKSAAEKPIGFWGELKAAITAPVALHDDPSFLTFQLIIWMEVNPDSPAINKAQLKKAVFPREGRNFVAKYGVNGRVFYCIFDIKTHQLTVELRNEDGQTVSPRRLERIFTDLLSPEVLGADAEEVEVTVIPTDDAITYVLGLDRLDKVEILVKRPNQDDITTATNRVMKDLIEQKAKSERRVLNRQPKTDGLELSEENETYARVAAHNGHVDSSGLDEEGNHDKRSTREVPKVVRISLAAGTSFLAALRNIARGARDDSEQL